MKRKTWRIAAIIIGVILFLSMPKLITAQKLGAGVKAGMIWSDFYGDYWEVPYWASKNGLCASAFISLRFVNVIEIQPELTYVRKGAEIVYMFNELTYYTLHLDYVEVPIVLKIIAPLKSPILPYVFGGSFYSKLVDDKLTVRTSSGTEEYPTENIRENEYGYIVGGGVELQFGFGKIISEFRFTRSLISFIDIQDGDTDVKNCGMSFMLGLGF